MKRYIFIIRIVTDGNGGLRGQLTEPVSGQRMLFNTAAELWAALLRELDSLPARSKPLNGETANDDNHYTDRNI